MVETDEGVNEQNIAIEVESASKGARTESPETAKRPERREDEERRLAKELDLVFKGELRQSSELDDARAVSSSEPRKEILSSNVLNVIFQRRQLSPPAAPSDPGHVFRSLIEPGRAATTQSNRCQTFLLLRHRHVLHVPDEPQAPLGGGPHRLVSA